MDRAAKAVISQILAESITPLLMQHGFHRKGRTYDRTRDGRRELITIEPHRENDRYGASFTANLGIVISEVDSVISLYPSPFRPEETHWHTRCLIGEVDHDGRLLPDRGGDSGGGWWEFDAQADLSAVGAEARRQVEHNALRFFDLMNTRDGLVTWLRQHPLPSGGVLLREAALAAYAGELALAQQSLDTVVAWASPGPNETLRQAARIAGRLGLDPPALTDAPALTAMFRMPAETSPEDRYHAFHNLDYKFRQYVELWRTTLPLAEPARLYHTTECTTDTGTVTFYGADPAELIEHLQRAFTRLSGGFAEITWQDHPARPE